MRTQGTRLGLRMDPELLLPLGFLLGYGLLSRRLGALGLSAPLAFVLFGLGARELELLAVDEGVVDLLAELTLMIVLFGDASRIELDALRREAGLPLRLLLLGMPLTIALGAALALLCFPGWSVWEACLLAAVLAPTDAALGQAVVSSEEVPLAVRQALNVESGLNDGIALPVVTIFASLASEGGQHEGGDLALFTLAQIGLGPLAGVAVAWLGGRAARWVCAREWTGESFERIAGLVFAPLAYLAADAIGGNGFIAAFVAGLVLGNTAPVFAGAVHDFLETEGQLLMIAVFTLVGALWAHELLTGASALSWLYALASLTLIRMLPVALSLLGYGARWPTRAFLGWFGPRGLASVLFALLVVERGTIAHAEAVFEVAMLTVLLSVLAHGLSARPAARAYGRWASELAAHLPEMQIVTAHRVRQPWANAPARQSDAKDSPREARRA